jgi:glutaconate CoA-transferase, subunit B
MGTEFTAAEVMVAAAAREIHDGEVAFVGMRLPLLAFCVAKNTHAPHAVGLFEAGVVRDTPAPELLFTMCDPPNVAGAAACVPMGAVMALLQRGDVQVGFVGGAEVDRYGNLNTSYIGSWNEPDVRLPGSGGAADIACLAERLVIIMPHERRRLRPRVDYITSPGYGDGPGWREREGLVRGGPETLITTLAVFGFDRETREATLVSHHPGVTIEDVERETGWPLRVSTDVRETPAPTADELAIIRAYDRDGYWTGSQA